MTNKTTPIDHVRVGAISAAIWANEHEKGTRYGVTVERRYRDPESGDWKSSSTFNRDDLLILAKVADLSHTRIHELQAAERAQNREQADAEQGESQQQPPSQRGGGASASRRNGRSR